MLFYQNTAPIYTLTRIKNAQHKGEQSLQVSFPITYCLTISNNIFLISQDLDSFLFIKTLGNSVSSLILCKPQAYGTPIILICKATRFQMKRVSSLKTSSLKTVEPWQKPIKQHIGLYLQARLRITQLESMLVLLAICLPAKT